MNTPLNTSGKGSLFKDHFSHDSDSYAKHRPSYPDALFAYLSALTKDHELAWDCATGSGQSAIRLTRHFNRVFATDASASQISKAQKHKAIQYSVARAENSGIESGSLDIITVAQALHWLDLPAFAVEVERTLKSGGILAVWTYNLLTIRADIDEHVNYLYSDVLGNYWPAERCLVEQGYKSIDFPYPELTTPDFNMTLNRDYEQLIAYLSTWSSVKTYISENKTNPIEIIQGKLLKLWDNPEKEMTVTWPLTVRIWQKS